MSSFLDRKLVRANQWDYSFVERRRMSRLEESSPVKITRELAGQNTQLAKMPLILRILYNATRLSTNSIYSFISSQLHKKPQHLN